MTRRTTDLNSRRWRVGAAWSDRVRFLGPVHGEKKWALLSSAHILALPSYSENFGNVVLEAMAVGCAVIVTPEVGMASVVHEGWLWRCHLRRSEQISG